jgi:6-pyruvoyltetrahydropterin/6-carboxytetrahydropterin synthase
MFEISKEFRFSASHQLHGLSDGHPCSRVHGHNYVVVVNLESKVLDNNGFVKDYGELKPIKEYIDTFLDHRHLNDIFEFNPTAENIAKMLFKTFKYGENYGYSQLTAVEVKETEKTKAIYYE